MAARLDPEGAELKVIHDLVDFAGKDVLEIGCGDGRLTWRFAHKAASVLAIDPKEVDIETAKDNTPDSLRDTVSFSVEDIRSVDLPAGAYDVAIISWSL